jgi:hypothetical protein
MPWGLKPLHASLSLPSGLMGIFCAVIEIPMLTMFHTGEEFAWLCRKFAFFGVFPLFSSPAVRGGGSRTDFKGSQFEKEIIIWRVRWYVASPISYR